MAICENCKKYYEPDHAAYIFERELSDLSYSNLEKDLCGDCAIEAIEDQEDGVYFETCEKCGHKFDLIPEQLLFDSHFDEANGTSLRDYWDEGPLCADCAIEVAESKFQDDDEDF